MTPFHIASLCNTIYVGALSPDVVELKNTNIIFAVVSHSPAYLVGEGQPMIFYSDVTITSLSSERERAHKDLPTCLIHTNTYGGGGPTYI